MGKIALLLIALLPLNIAPTTQDIDIAFLQNNPKILFDYFPEQGYIHVSFPPPISLSDQLSNQQAFFLFKKIFSSYTTLEFYSGGAPHVTSDNSLIYTSRWSFKDRRNNLYVFQVFFYLVNKSLGHKGSPLSAWKILEIRVEKL